MSTSGTPRLKVEGVRVRFGGTVALDGVDLTINPGEVLALIGENGAGKSTLMKVLSGAQQADDGRMFLNGNTYRPRSPMEARHAGIAMIYQELSLAPSLTVQENIFLGMEPSRFGVMDHQAMRERAAAAITELGHEIPLHLQVKNLSISDQQLVEIARARAVGCSVLILDEPTSSITRTDVERLFALSRSLKERGHSIIYISHFIEEVKEIADRFVILRDGKTVGEGLTADATPDRIVSMMIGRSLDDLYPRSAHATTGEAVLDVSNLSDFGRLESASFSLRRGEVLGVFGLVGSGRTDLLRAIFGLEAVKNGQVRVGSYSTNKSASIVRVYPQERWSDGVGMVSEDRKGEGLALSRSLAENLILSNPQSLERFGYLSPAKANAVTNDWIGQLKIKCRAPDQKIVELSGGNQQKIAIARLLHHDVDVLLLDEPTRGIDVGSKKQIYQLIDSLALRNKAVLMISSYLPELMGTCDRIAVMCKGKLTEPLPIAEITEHAVMLLATATTSEQPA